MLTGRRTATWEEVRRAATSDDSLFRAYVADWSGGAHYSTPDDDLWFEDLLLQHLEYLPGRTFSVASLADETLALFSRTLAGVAGDRFPKRSIDSLVDIGAIRLVAGAVRLTDAGRAIAVNALGVGDLPVIEELAIEAARGAGPLTLLYIACTSDFIGRSSQHLGVRPEASANVLDHMLGQILKANNASGRPAYRGTFMRHFPDEVVDAVGKGEAADELRGLLTVDSARGASDVQLTALWRAFNVFLRWVGSSYSQIAELKNPSSSAVPEVALDSLAGNVAYILSAASDLLGSNPTTMHFRTLSYFAAEVELGVPASLAPFMRLNRPSLNRERLLGVGRLLGKSDSHWDGLSELFNLYIEKQSTVVASHDGWHPLPESEVAWVSEQLVVLDERRRSSAYSVAPSIESMLVPGLEGLRVADVLHQIPQGNGPQILMAMLKPFAVEPRYEPELRAVSVELRTPDDQPRRTSFYFPDRVVNNSYLDSVSARLGERENALVVAVEGTTFGAVDRGRFLQDSCAIINPSLLVEMVARLYARNVVEDGESAMDDPLDEIFGTTASRGVDIGPARLELSRVLLNNAPVLSRTDLENRLAFVDLVQNAQK